MAVMVFLKALADSSFLFMMLGSIAVHFGTPPYLCVATCLLICIGQMLSYILSTKKKELRLIPLLLPFAALALPGKTLSWAIICAIIFGYAVFVAVSRRYIPDDGLQKTIFKITLGGIIAMLLIMLMIGGNETSYMIVVISGIISACSSILLIRSLRHEKEVYSRFSYQAVNIAVMAIIALISVLLGTKSVVNAVGTALSAVYRGITFVIVKGVTYAIRGIAALFAWLPSLFGSCSGEEKSTEEINLDMRSAADLLETNTQAAGFPEWLKIVFIVIGALAALLILIMIFRRLAGRKLTEDETAENVIKEKTGTRSYRDHDTGNVGIVRKQYRKYLAVVSSAGCEVRPYETTKDIDAAAPEKLKNAAAQELRQIYLEARYNGRADKEDAARAKELVRLIKG